MADRTPFNKAYCRAIKCEHRHGNKCAVDHCEAPGGQKWAVYWTENGKLPGEES